MISSLYVHIPFCTHICTYCDFCKMYYKKELAIKYLDALEKEIKKYNINKPLKTIYVGGGTPSSLDIELIEKLLIMISKLNKEDEYEFTFECNIDSMNEDKLKLLKEYGVNRISYGVETFNSKYLKYLNRKHNKDDVFKIVDITRKYFDNINIDLMYAFTTESILELKSDLEYLIKLNVPHISTYSLMIEPHTVLANNNTLEIDDELDSKMYELICSVLNKHGYKHYEISNFARNGYESKHNLTYWNNLEYYGVGLGSSGYINGVRYTNTKSFNKYVDNKYVYESTNISKYDKMEEEMFLGLRKVTGVSVEVFLEKYKVSMFDIFPVKSLIEKGLLELSDGYVRIPEDKLYLSNEVLINFVGDYEEE